MLVQQRESNRCELGFLAFRGKCFGQALGDARDQRVIGPGGQGGEFIVTGLQGHLVVNSEVNRASGPGGQDALQRPGLETEMAVEVKLEHEFAASIASQPLERCVELAWACRGDEGFRVLDPPDGSYGHGLDLGRSAAAHVDEGDMARPLIGFGKTIGLMRSGIPGFLAGLHEAVPVAEGDVVDLREKGVSRSRLIKLAWPGSSSLSTSAWKLTVLPWASTIRGRSSNAAMSSSRSQAVGSVAAFLCCSGQGSKIASSRSKGSACSSTVRLGASRLLLPLNMVGEPETARPTVVVVAGNDIDGHRQLTDPLKGSRDQPWWRQVAVEDVAGDNNETRLSLAGDLADAVDGVEPLLPQQGLPVGIVNTRERLAELPVGSVDEGRHRWFCGRVGRRLWKASECDGPFRSLGGVVSLPAGEMGCCPLCIMMHLPYIVMYANHSDDLGRPAQAGSQSALERSCTLALVEEALQRTLLADAAIASSEPTRLPTSCGRGLQPGVDLDDSASLLDVMEDR